MNCVTYDRRSYSVLKIDSLKEPLFCRQHNSLIEPVFFYHPCLVIEGNCRMCLDEMENSPKPIASCATPVSEGMDPYPFPHRSRTYNLPEMGQIFQA
jgi:predicted molibdopterin-dependent oxidoreductase YjgC